MNTPTISSPAWLVSLVIATVLSGCAPKQASQEAGTSVPKLPNSEQPNSEQPNSEQPNSTIVEGKQPTEEQRQAMLAAKDQLFQQLSGRLMQAMGAQGPAEAIAVCQSEAKQIAAEVGQQHALSIGRTGVRLRNPDNQPPPWAVPLTQARTESPIFAILSNGNAAALLPIKLQGQCLMCHGPKEQIAPLVSAKLAKLYPDDQATGFQEGELRGWFWIELPAETTESSQSL